MTLAPFHYEKWGGVMGGVMERKRIWVLAKVEQLILSELVILSVA